MKKYRVTGRQATFMSAVMKLTEEQYKARRHALEPLENGCYRVTAQTSFKQGEAIGYDGEVNKTLLEQIDEVEPNQPVKPLIERKVEEIRAALPGLSDEELLALGDAEAAGKNRKTVIDAIDAEMEARKGNDNDNTDQGGNEE